jgi:hypothetical protein
VFNASFLTIELLLREWCLPLWMLTAVVLIGFSVDTSVSTRARSLSPHIDPLACSITVPVEITAATILITFWDNNVSSFLPFIFRRRV